VERPRAPHRTARLSAQLVASPRASLGLLEAREGDGTCGREPSELESVITGRAASAHGEDVVELHAVLKEYGAGLAAVRRTPEDIAEMRRPPGDVDAAGPTEETRAVAAVDGDFHRAVVCADGSDPLTGAHEHPGGARVSAPGTPPWNAGTKAEHRHPHTQWVDAVEESGVRSAASAVVRTARDGTTTREGAQA
jgi:DNA-binding FadR family transcriptional regulator